MKPKVSIIVPVYNVEKYLDRCMESLLNQTLKDIEIILVDDGSPDNCPQMCDDYAKTDSRVKVVHKANAGLGYARNSGLDVASGEYVAFVDSDDYVDTKIYESLLLEAENSGADVVFCKYYTEQTDGTWVDCDEVTKRMEWNNEGINEFLLNIIATEPYVKKERKYAAITISLLNNTLLVLIFSIHRLSINVFPFPIVCVGDCYNNECCNTNKT